MTPTARKSDRLFLTASATLALTAGSLLAIQARALPDRFDRAEPEDRPYRLDTAGPAAIDAALDHAQRTPAWHTSNTPLLRSKVLLIKDGTLYDLLDPTTPICRPPIANRYLVDHQLPAERSDVAMLDHDGDGFTNAEEFLGGQTDPRDVADHPPFTDKLRLARLETDQFSLTFTSGDPKSGFSVRETRQDFGIAEATNANHYVTKDTRFGKIHAGRWQVIGYTPKEETNPKTGALRDISELSVRDLSQPEAAPLILRRQTPLELPTHRAAFRFDLPGSESELPARPTLGERFTLPVEPGVTYELIRLSPESATIRNSSGGATITIRSS